MQTHLLHPQFSLDRGILKEGDAQVDGLDDAGTLLTISLSLVLPQRRVKRELAGTRVLMIPFSNVPVIYLGKGGRSRLVHSSRFHHECPLLWLFRILGIWCIHRSIYIDESPITTPMDTGTFPFDEVASRRT